MPTYQSHCPPSEDTSHHGHHRVKLHHVYQKHEMDSQGLPVDRPTKITEATHHSHDLDRGELSSAIIDMHAQLAKKQETIEALQLEVTVLSRMKEEAREAKRR